MRSDNLHELPPDLPVPGDDGAADHLAGAAVPDLGLLSTNGREVFLAREPGRTVLYSYPRTGEPDKDPPEGWDMIPGARGCTPQSCGFRDHHQELAALGARVYGLSTQDTEYQREMATRLHLPFEVLSDAGFALTRALRLPTFDIAGMTLLKRIALILRGGRIEKVFYPVFPPDRNATEVVGWLESHPL